MQTSKAPARDAPRDAERTQSGGAPQAGEGHCTHECPLAILVLPPERRVQNDQGGRGDGNGRLRVSYRCWAELRLRVAGVASESYQPRKKASH